MEGSKINKKITIKLNENDWHGYSTESLWGELVENDKYIIRNIPFYSKGLSMEDLVEVEELNNTLYFKKVAKSSGHSTYRVFIIENKPQEEFDLFWKPLEKLGCTYERATKNLFAIDVPLSVNIHEVYKLLENGEKAGYWEFEEGHCGHPN